MKGFLIAILSGVVVGVIGVFSVRFFFDEDITGWVPAISGGVAGYVMVMQWNKQERSNG